MNTTMIKCTTCANETITKKNWASMTDVINNSKHTFDFCDECKNFIK